MSDDSKLILAGLITIAIVGVLLSTLDAVKTIYAPEPDPCQTYREMRKIWEDTSGDYGWPRGAIKGCET